MKRFLHHQDATTTTYKNLDRMWSAIKKLKIKKVSIKMLLIFGGLKKIHPKFTLIT